MNRRALLLFLCVLVPFVTGGCDIAPNVRISGDPVNTPGTELDPESKSNLVAYFYLDRPVVGLPYRCKGQSVVPYIGETNEDGRLVCPRDTKLTFFVGTPENPLDLGTVNLNMYGETLSDTARNNVVMTPSTLYGTTADSARNEVTNIFNLLTALDLGGSEARSKIYLFRGLDTFVNPVIAPYLEDLNLSSSPDAFAVAAEPMLQALMDDPLTGGLLVGGGEMFPEAVAMGLVDAALRKSRSGLYRHLYPVTGVDEQGKRSATMSAQILVGRERVVTGLSASLIVRAVNSTTLAQEMQILPLRDGASLQADGRLTGFSFADQDNPLQLTLTGRMVNDRLYGTESQLDPAQSILIPRDYVYAEADEGKLVLDGVMRGDITMYAVATSLPDVPLEDLPVDGTLDSSPWAYLPLDYALRYEGYKDGSETPESDYDKPGKRQAFPYLFFRIMPSGDILSDVDGDCSEVALSGGRLIDQGGQEEYLIGQVGSVFKGDDLSTYMTFLIAIYSPGHPLYGFTFGTTSLFTELSPVVLNTATGELRSKLCKPGEACTERLRWFNDVVYGRDAYGVDLANGTAPASDPDRDKALYRRGDYLGEVVEGVRYCISGDE